MFFQIIYRRKSLYFLFHQITIRHRMAHCHNLETHLHQHFDYFARGLAFSAACSYSAYRNDGFSTLDLCLRRSQQHEIGSGGIHYGAHTHHFVVSDIAVGEYTDIRFQFTYQFYQICFGMNGNSLWVKLSGKFRRIFPAVDIGNLCCSKCHNIVHLVVAEIGVEIVKITTSCADDNYVFLLYWHSNRFL